MRLDKFLSQQLEISRTLVARELKAKKVAIDGETAKNGALKISPQQKITYEGRELIQVIGPRYFMLYKPKGVVCANDDAVHATILYFIAEPAAGKLHAAGRLDLDTTGLVLLTDDGQWSHRVTSPRHHCEKTYLVTLAQPLDQQQIEQLSQGIWLRGEKTRTQPAKLQQIDDFHLRLTISEGRYHQVKRMFAAVGNHVVDLHRESVGAILLDSSLSEGQYRALNQVEIDSVY